MRPYKPSIMFTDRELWLIQGAINTQCMKLLKKRKISDIEEYEAIEKKLGIGFATGHYK